MYRVLTGSDKGTTSYSEFSSWDEVQSFAQKNLEDGNAISVVMKETQDSFTITPEQYQAAVEAKHNTGIQYALNDEQLQSLWEALSDVPFGDGENDMTLDIDWLHFPAGTEREDIWHFFDEAYSKGVAALMYEMEDEPSDGILIEDATVSTTAEIFFDDRTESNIVGSYMIDTPHIEEYLSRIDQTVAQASSSQNFTPYASVYDNGAVDLDLYECVNRDDGSAYRNLYSICVSNEIRENLREMLMEALGADNIHELIGMTAAQREIDYGQMEIVSKSANEAVTYRFEMPLNEEIYMIESSGLMHGDADMTITDKVQNDDSLSLQVRVIGESKQEIQVEATAVRNGETITALVPTTPEDDARILAKIDAFELSLSLETTERSTTGPKYEIIYDYCNEDGYEEHNCCEHFEGSWDELQDYLKQLKENGCYNISATDIDPEYEAASVTAIETQKEAQKKPKTDIEKD